jgi:hypothetical protein
VRVNSPDSNFAKNNLPLQDVQGEIVYSLNRVMEKRVPFYFWT